MLKAASMKRALCLVMTMLICACAPQWEKPGATQDDFNAAEEQCTKTAGQEYPPALHQVLKEGAYTTQNLNGCFGSPILADCLRSQSIIVPPTFETVDDNEKPRAGFIGSCLREKGWRPVQGD
jgi:hypothetical protein